MLFSATFDSKALVYARKIATGAVEMLTQKEDEQLPVENVKHFVFKCRDVLEKLDVLEKFLRNINIGSCIIFTNVDYSNFCVLI